MHGLNDISLSRCSDSESANNAAVLTNQSVAEDNICNMTENLPLEMKLTSKSQDCSSIPLPEFGFGSSLAAQVVSEVNDMEQCGFALHMLGNVLLQSGCILKEYFYTCSYVNSVLECTLLCR